ncbi:Structural maintenance of chromosomes protein 1B [Elasticomyces elasticus]|nr:Structural maintenance of chromosomes protein 1B [Elasticomyces elasticus]KAK4972191.1 Structural maintenance of chromosomes protein 1B [Elasticomyces elasticus]
MGKLLALELNNFKSYKGTHILQFGDSYFTSIIGPNGSGKSNSMDAISFVLGIKSSHLRSTQLEDLVYRGRVLKQAKIQADGTATEDVNGDANGDAEPGASDDEDEDTQKSTQRNNPKTAWVMAVYEDDAGEEQRWKRSITSAGQSEYRINNRVVTAKQYNEALEAENILIKARNFLVFQGDIEAVANQEAKDITKLIEQISGSQEYKAEYERLKAEKEKADDEQGHKMHQRRGINGEIRQYQQQKEELDRFQTLSDEKDAATVTHVLWKLYHFQRTIEDSTAEIQKHQEELKEYRRSVQKYEDKLEEAKRDHAKVGKEVSKYEREIKRKEKALEEKANDLVPIDEKLLLTNKSLKTLERRVAEHTQERDLQQETKNKMQGQLDKVEKAQQRWEEEWRVQQQQAGRELSEEDMQEYRQLRAEVHRRSGDHQMKVENLTRQVKTDEETVNSLRSRVESTQAHVESLEAEVSALSERKSEFTRDVKTTTKEIDAKKKAINALASARERTTQMHRELEEKLYEVLQKLNAATEFQRETRKDASQRETVAQLKRIFPGVKGMVHTQCKPAQKKYENAMVTALGRHWDSVIVESSKVAQDCMAYLKDQRIGQMTFLPLDTIIHEQPNANLRGLHQGMRLAIDVIEFDPSVERAMSSACGNTIVTDTLKIAKHLCYDRNIGAKAVVIDGTIIHKGGNMTGGQEPNDRKRHFEEAEVETLRTMVEKFRSDIESLPKGHKRQAEEEGLVSELEGLQAKLSFAQDELKALNRNIESKTKELDHERRQLAEAQPKYNKEAQGLEGLRNELAEHTSSIADVEDEIYGEFCRRLGYESIREYERQQGTMQQEAEQKKNAFKTQISRLNNQLVFETQRLAKTEQTLRAAEAQVQQNEERVAQLESEKEAISGEVDVLNAEIDQINEQLSALREKLNERADKVNEARREVQKRSKSVEKTLKEVAALEADVQKASTGRYAELKDCKLKNIDIPLERGSRKLDALPNEDVILEEDQDAMDVDGEGRAMNVNDYGIHIDFSELAEDLQQDDSDECGIGLDEKVSTMSAELEKMAVNTRSADRLEATSERLRATDREFNDARTSAKKAGAAFDQVKKKRTDLFTKAYEHIKDQLPQVYSELTKTESYPLGGQASLDADEDDEPYLAGIRYNAMPPGKRFRDMELLSGGEKTMAALALLFAVHTFAPSPFFVLDEVDAALDTQNTEQLAQYVKEHAGPGMQFVVISLKTGLFQNSETLVGVMRDQAVNSSRALTLDLRKYQAA